MSQSTCAIECMCTQNALIIFSIYYSHLEVHGGRCMRMNVSYDNVDNVSYGCVLDEDGDTTAAAEGIYDTIPEEDDSDSYNI